MSDITNTKQLLTEVMNEDAKDGLYHIGDTNKMITAVEWFYQRILAEDIKAVFEQAKAMEKEQIIKAFENGIIAYNNQDRITDDIDNDSEFYYNQTYKR